MARVGWSKTLKIVFLLFAVASFVLMIYGIINWYPLYTVMIFVPLGFTAVGLVLIFKTLKLIVLESTVRGKIADSIVSETHEDLGSGYCPRCGALLNEGDTCYGACERRL